MPTIPSEVLSEEQIAQMRNANTDEYKQHSMCPLLNSHFKTLLLVTARQENIFITKYLI